MTGQYAAYDDRFQIEVDEPAGVVEKKILLSNPVIPWAITELMIGDVKITYAQSQISQDLVLKTEQTAPSVDLFLQLRGRSAIRRSGQPNRLYEAGQCNLIHTPVSEGELQLTGPAVSSFVVQFPITFFSRFSTGSSGGIGQLENSMAAGRFQPVSVHNTPVTPAIKAALFGMLHCPYKGLAKRLFLESKLLELVALQLGQASHTLSNLTLKGTDVDKLMAVREWLEANFLQPVTLLGLARLVGLNDFKLKKGFRELFHTTVFNYLADLRLTHARHLLLNEQRLVGEVADELGYSQIHHFTNAFKKRFGYLPRELKK